MLKIIESIMHFFGIHIWEYSLELKEYGLYFGWMRQYIRQCKVCGLKQKRYKQIWEKYE